MQTRLPFLLVALLAACATEQSNAPATEEGQGATLPSASAVFPPSNYKVTLVPGEGVFEDVSDTKLVVGSINSNAVAMQLGGPVVNLHQGGAPYSAAHAVNNLKQIAGHINFGAPWAPDLRPAFWKAVGAQPIRLPYAGEAMDLNDAGITVGSLQRGGTTYAFAWDVMGVTGTSLHFLPALPGGRYAYARAINADWIILGESDSKMGVTTVVWRWNGAGWSGFPVKGGIVGYDIDSGLGIVGATVGRASYGDPDHLGYFATVGLSSAWGVNPRGVATGDDEGSSPGWPQYTSAFVADQGGAMTVLPMPNNPNGFAWRASYGYGINTCGIAVGTAWPFPGHPYTAQPIVWDPGC